ncbi:hypothetical protein [Sinanaerobacter sp. ZZT-01]|uniref:hypothetical protein n=1 Tax=Sinanaerobacter sp. ZZT-01 TaxID=3111540 RepID=UPI002D76A156|nr:hypothetical protein [Sinanaerobacter sp. ZZT-01]WRR94253.1 hypothetical protein U5921_03790 [Sinanaerobacter sp. ZZT-01]
METIVAAGITAVVTLIVAWIGYNSKVNKLIQGHKDLSSENGNLSNEHETLSKEHRFLTKEHNGLEDAHKRLEHGQERIFDCTSKIWTDMQVTKEKQANRYNCLTVQQKNIVDSVENIKAMADELKRIAAENKELHQRVSELEQEKALLQKENKNIRRTRDRGLER